MNSYELGTKTQIGKFGVYFFILLLFLAPVQASAGDEWTSTDMALQLTYTALHIADWSQTLYIVDHPDEYSEANPVLGRHPSGGRVNSYFLSTLVVHTVISYVLPKDYRRIWHGLTIGFEFVIVSNNVNAGIKIGF